MKKIICVVCLICLVLLLIITNSSSKSYLNKNDNIPDNDEMLIKDFRLNHEYTINELKTLKIKYLGEVDNYRIYYVPFKGSSGVLNEKEWIKDGFTFPIESQTRIIGIKADKLYTLGNLLYETQIDIKALYNIMPDKYKVHNTSVV